MSFKKASTLAPIETTSFWVAAERSGAVTQKIQWKAGKSSEKLNVFNEVG